MNMNVFSALLFAAAWEKKALAYMSKMHEQNLLYWENVNMSWKFEYKKVVLSDERKIDLDGFFLIIRTVCARNEKCF